MKKDRPSERRSLKLSLLLIFVAGTILALNARATSESDTTVMRMLLDDDIITPPVAEYVESAIEKAEEDGAQCLIIELDTPGGLLSSTRNIVKAIMNSPVPIVVYVAPSGARAGSAGVFITLSADVAAMAPSTNIGAAHPVDLGGDKKKSDETISETIRKLLKGDEGKGDEKKTAPPMEAKILNDTTAWVKAIADARGQNASWAVKAVTESVSVTDIEAMKLGVIDIIAADTNDLLDKLDGREVEAGGNRMELSTRGATVIDYEKGFRIKILTALAHPNIAYILMMLGFYGLLFEFTNPGIGFPGIAGAFCLILAFFGLQVLPTNYAGIALIALAIVLFVAEVKITSYGMLTVGGVAALIFGSLILFRSPYGFMRISIPIVAAFTVATLAIAIFLATIAARSQKRRSVIGAEGMKGERGKVQFWEGDHGKVFVHGEIWDAYGPEGLERDEEVEVRSAQGMKLEVEKKQNP